MNGLVQKRHFWQVLRAFGFRKAVQLLISREPVALIVLMA